MQKAGENLGNARKPALHGGLGGLARGVARGWRIVRTACCFVAFGTIAPLLAVTVMPIMRALPGTDREKEIRCQAGVHWAIRFFLREMQVLRVTQIRVEGAEKLRKPGQLVVANHPTLIDACLLISLMPQADCVIKGSHMNNRYLGGSARGAGYVPNWDGPSLVADCVERLVQGRNVIIFPEGTRSPVGGLGPFARGAAHIAMRSGRDPVPVTIHCDPATLFRGQPWWDVPDRRFTLTVRVGDPVPVNDVVDSSMSQARAARAVTAALRTHFESEAAAHEADKKGKG